MLSRSELLKFFHAECRARDKSIGFARKRSGYWRIKNDLLQTFTLQFSRDGREGRVSFGVYPLCMNITEPDDHGLYYLHEFSLECRIRHKWSFDKTECNTVSECLLPVFQMIDSDLMPFFETAIDCSSAFAETLRIEYVFESNRKEYLRLGNIVDMADPFEVRILWDPARFYMALRLHNYEWARNSKYKHKECS